MIVQEPFFFTLLVSLQQNSFSDCRLVKPGGVLVYSTCSIDPEENGDRVEAFILRHPVRPPIKIIRLSELVYMLLRD